MKKIISEFKTFVERGNVVDLAVGVVMGSAFGKIVTSVVDDLLMPIIGVIIGGHDFSNLAIKVGSAEIKYGSLINNIINFFIFICIYVNEIAIFKGCLGNFFIIVYAEFVILYIGYLQFFFFEGEVFV